MSDVNFEIGKTSYSITIFAAIVLFAVFFGGRMILKRMVLNPECGVSVIDIAFWSFIGILAVCVVVSAILQSKRPSISVSGKTLFYNGKCWTSDEISCVKCSRWLELVEVYANGRKVLSFPWELEHSELLIAWANRCGIVFEDKRMSR